MSRDVERSLLEIDFASLTRGPFTPSPAAWEDQVLYFLMLDRFSDGNEKGGYADASGRPVKFNRDGYHLFALLSLLRWPAGYSQPENSNRPDLRPGRAALRSSLFALRLLSAG